MLENVKTRAKKEGEKVGNERQKGQIEGKRKEKGGKRKEFFFGKYRKIGRKDRKRGERKKNKKMERS